MIFILRVLGSMFSCLVLTSTKMKTQTISVCFCFFMGAAILYQKAYVVSNGKPTVATGNST